MQTLPLGLEVGRTFWAWKVDDTFLGGLESLKWLDLCLASTLTFIIFLRLSICLDFNFGKLSFIYIYAGIFVGNFLTLKIKGVGIFPIFKKCVYHFSALKKCIGHVPSLRVGLLHPTNPFNVTSFKIGHTTFQYYIKLADRLMLRL